MTKNEILTANETKTWKIQRLLELGLSRNEVAEAMGIGYGFVQNVFARMYPERISASRRRFAEIVEEAVYRLTDFTFNHTFGVEIEAFGISETELKEELNAAGILTERTTRSFVLHGRWKVTSDSSISGENSFELVSPKLSGESGLRTLKTVLLILRGLGARVNTTCGLHVHLDASGFDKATWANLYRNYAILEPTIDGFMPPSRRGNNNSYCRSMRIEGFMEKIARAETIHTMAESLIEIEKLLTNRERRYKLNSKCFWSNKSVEFRQHSGTTDFKKISNWILFLARLTEYSKHAVVTGSDFNAMRNFLPDEIADFFEARTRELSV